MIWIVAIVFLYWLSMTIFIAKTLFKFGAEAGLGFPPSEFKSDIWIASGIGALILPLLLAFSDYRKVKKV